MIDGYAASQLSEAFGGEEAATADGLVATVLGTGADGITWVHIPGGPDRTPLASTTVEPVPGHSLRVKFDGVNAYGVGDFTEPSISAESAKELMVPIATAASEAARGARIAQEQAQAATDSAERAEQSASAAAGIVEVLDDMAETGQTTVEQILRDAGAAGTAAQSALQSAKAATYGLADVEKVVGTVGEIARHGHYVSQSGESFDSTATYYVRDANGPRIDSDGNRYSLVAEPVAADIGSYYRLAVDEAICNYLSSHLWQDLYGLNIDVDEPGGFRIHEGTVDGRHAMGLYILDAAQRAAAAFTAALARIGEESAAHVDVTASGVDVSDGSESVAAFGASGARVGRESGAHMLQSGGGIEFLDGHDFLMGVGVREGGGAEVSLAGGYEVATIGYSGGAGRPGEMLIMAGADSNTKASIGLWAYGRSSASGGAGVEIDSDDGVGVRGELSADGDIRSGGDVLADGIVYAGQASVSLRRNGSSGNHGVYSEADDAWICYRNSQGVNKFNGYELNKSVPADAVFGYTLAIQAVSGTSAAASIAGGATASLSAGLSPPAGYAFAGIAQLTTNHSSACTVNTWTRSGNTVSAHVRNLGTGAQSTTITVTAIYAMLRAS